MPGFNGTGPDGAGAMTGGRRGLCNIANDNRGTRFATGFGRGMGFGRRSMRGSAGMRRAFGSSSSGWNQPELAGYYASDATDEIEMLKNQANSTKNSLDAINRRIADLEKQSE